MGKWKIKTGTNAVGAATEEERGPTVHVREAPALKGDASGDPGWRVGHGETRQ